MSDQDFDMLRLGEGKNFESPRSDLSGGNVSKFIDKFDDNVQILRGSYSSDSLDGQITDRMDLVLTTPSARMLGPNRGRGSIVQTPIFGNSNREERKSPLLSRSSTTLSAPVPQTMFKKKGGTQDLMIIPETFVSLAQIAQDRSEPEGILIGGPQEDQEAKL